MFKLNFSLIVSTLDLEEIHNSMIGLAVVQRFIVFCVNVTIKNTYTINNTWRIIMLTMLISSLFFFFAFDKFISFNQRQVIIFHCMKWYYFNDELYDNSVCWNEWHKASITNKIMFVLILYTVCWLPKLKHQHTTNIVYQIH